MSARITNINSMAGSFASVADLRGSVPPRSKFESILLAAGLRSSGHDVSSAR